MSPFKTDYPVEEENSLSPEQLAGFRSQLLRWRQDLVASLTPAFNKEKPEIDMQGDWLDLASRSTEAELSRAEQQRVHTTIREIDAALQRIEEGTYGFCCESGEAIGLRRLQALPIARFSVAAQELRERRRVTVRA
ncbi:MAG: TraR/DksA family transcriptional regulator [Desulfuromonadales bacterium]|nr:TraR/DksA family transcriptional regulator [Desulfuromonadales bacterium]